MSLEQMRDDQAITALGYAIFQELRKRKKEEDRTKKKAKRAGYLLIAFSICLVTDLFFFQTQRLMSIEQLHLLLSDPLIVLLSLLALLTWFAYQKFQKDADDAEDDFDDLREEAIKRSWEIWAKELDGTARAAAMNYLLEKEDINLYYK
ncbi:DUF2663 family protein [Sporolactobacillus spathodeae]|uniref:DUF2663 family protein n=1 Tax=Sporolactobacillus spathodeae TaxID=1465502 RepID=A0ABS2QA40_9BACL|nr:DUF2663 family protein [Sporolactobacillus spathodeae]MBM7657837.1 hypothetical protein [Sporolactobacillus spathodeae]